MATDNQRDRGPDDRFMDYKKLFYGACSCIALLAGFAYQLSSANHTDEVERNSATNRVQWERLKDLNDQVIELRGDIKTLRRDVDELRENGRRR